jgi:large repetitive protein
MKLKNYSSLFIVLILNVFFANAQESKKQTVIDKSEYHTLSKGINAYGDFVTRLPGTPGNVKVQGDLVLIGNNIIGTTGNTQPTFDASGNITNLAALTALANTAYNSAGKNNNGRRFEYIDVDTDPTTYSSSTADLALKNIDGTVNNCKNIAYAGLYWSAFYPFTRSNDTNLGGTGTPINNDWNTVKFKVPNGSYVDLSADTTADLPGQEDEIVYREYDAANPENSYGSPYVCYKNVTNLINSLADANGTYAVANMRAGVGRNNYGLCGGWTLVIIFESPSFPSKYITVFDGYKQIGAGNNPAPVDFNISGFKTVPAPFPVRLKIGTAALEGDNNFLGDNLQIASPIGNTSFTSFSNTINPVDNFFNSSISVPTTTTPFSAYTTNRNPNSTNTLGFDVDIVDLIQSNNSVIANDATNATLRLTTNNDSYGAFLQTFAVEIIEPNIVVTKIVKDTANLPIGQNAPVALGQVLTYEITYQNIGNDSAQNFTITDLLPNFVTLQSVTMPAGVTYTNTAVAGSAGQLLFTIPSSQAIKFSPSYYTIKIVVQLTSDPNVFITACSNIVKNTATANYSGIINTSVFNDSSIASFNGCLQQPSTTNFIANLGNNLIIRNEQLCGSTLTLTAPSGYLNYIWTNVATGAVIGTTGVPTLVVNSAGQYNVFCDVGSPCLPINIQFNVSVFLAGNIPNPVIPYSDYQLPACISGTDRGVLPIINLCGNVKRLITSGIANATFTWQKLVDGSCPDIPLCHAENPIVGPPCVWNTVATTNTFEAEFAGEYRVRILFQGGCERTFYFKVFKSNLVLDAEVRNISCNVTGRIIASGLAPSGYEYSINGTVWQTSPIFNNVATGPYNVCGRLIPIPAGSAPLPGSCTYCKSVFVLNVSSGFLVSTVVTQPLCNGDNGSIQVQIGGATPQFTYEIFKKGTPNVLLYTFGPTNNVTYNSPQLPAGIYVVCGKNQDGCLQCIEVEIKDPPFLTLTASLTTAVTCQPGLITLTPIGGTGPYSYTYDGGNPTTDQLVVPVPVPNTGAPQVIDYSVEVTDYNNCTANTIISVTTHPEPVVTATKKNIYCYGNFAGEINFNLVSNLGGYVLAYGINGPTGSFSAGNLSGFIFTGLAAGTYTPTIRYSYPATGNVDCYIELPALIITEPAVGLIASGGVSELAGCGPGNTGKVRITNPQGGTPFQPGNYYLYYFNTPPPALPSPFVGFFSTAGSQTSNEAFLPVGCRTIYIQDASGCSFPMNVCLDPPPTPPTLNPPVTTFNCDATSTSVLTVNSNGGNFSYDYYLDGVLNTNIPKNIITNVPCGPHNIRVDYTAINIPTFNNLLLETFGSGNPTTTPGINPAYCFNDQRINAPYLCGTRSIEDNQYSVASFFWRGDDPLINNTGAWFHFKDHTTNGIDPNGRFLHVNIGGAAGANGVLYSKVINDIVPNQPINVRAYVANLLRLGFNGGSDPSFVFELVNGAGTVIAQSPVLPATDPVLRSSTWQLKQVTLDPGANSTLTFNVRSGSTDYGGNDAVIDDIEVYQRPKACATSTTFPINIDCGLAFSAQVTQFSDVKCNGTNTGTVTIAAQNFNSTYQYQVLPNPAWLTANVSPFTINNLPAGTTIINVRYDSSSLPCTKTLTQIIGSPAVLTASAIAIQATCLVGASINATASSGGTPGTAGYTYQLLNSPALTPVTGFLLPQSSPIFSNVPAGTYIVRVKDSNICSDDIDVALTIFPLPVLTATISNTSDLCYDPVNQATIVVNAVGGTAPFQYAISPSFVYGATTASTTASFVVTPGTYTVKVRDSKLCEYETASVIIAPQLVLSGTFVKDVTCGPIPANNLAVVTVTATGGLAPLTFQVNLGAGFVNLPIAGAVVVGNTLTYSTLTSGTVRIRVTDANAAPNACTAETATFTITTPIAVTGTAASTQASCGFSNGTVTLVALTGVGPFTYSFNSPPIVNNTGLFSGVAVANNYPWEITDSKGCKVTGTVNVTQPNPITGTAVIKTNYTCLGTGCIEAQTVSGGFPGYEYSIGGAFQASPEFCGLTDGPYTITIKDSKDCTFTTNSVTLDKLNKPIDLTFTNTAPNCPSEKASVTLTTVSELTPFTGNPPFTYSITAPASLIGNVPVGNTFNNLPPSTPITFKVVDAKGCEYSETYNFAPITKISVLGQLVNNVLCFSPNNTGSIKFTVSGFTTNYSYTITEASNNISQINVPSTALGVITVPSLPAGSYTIVVTDLTTNCTATATVLVIKPLIPLSFIKTVTPKTCLTGGSVSVVTTGGTGTISYLLTLPDLTTQTIHPFTNLTQVGLYTIEIKDSNNCTFSETFNIINSGAPTLVLDTTNSDFCFGGVNANAGKIVVTASGGTGTGYQYFLLPSVTPNSPIGNTFPNLSPGTYNIQVKDSAGCPSNIVTVVIEPKLTVGATLVKGLDCSASPNAEYTINVANGYPSYSQQIQFNANPISASTPIVGSSFLFTASSGAGTYIIRITDNKGCTAETTIVINPLVPVNATTTQVNVLCNGANTGSFTISPSGGTAGTAGYLVQFNGTGAFLPNNFTHSGLVAGTYTYIVRDSKNCTFAGNVTITDLFAPILGVPQVTQLTIPGGNCGGIFTPNGKICFPAITGGQAGYTITMTDGSNPYPPIFTATGIPTVANPMCYDNLDIGNYLIIITDSNNCSVSYDVTISGPVTDLDVNPSIIPTTDCLLGGCIKLTASGPLLSLTDNLWFAIVQSNPAPLYFVGSPFFQPATNPGITPTGDPLRNESTFCNLIPGKIYKFTVYSEANQCYFPATATAPVQQFSPFASTVTPNSVSCSGGADGSVNFTFSNYSSTSVTYQIFRQVDDVAVGLPVPITGLTSGGPTQTVNNFGVLTPGICYYILFTENNGLYNNCKTASPIFCISQATTALTLSTLEVKKDACGKNIGVASGTGNGGAGGYKYQIFPSGFVPPVNIPVNNPTYLAFVNSAAWTSTSSFGGLAAGNYVIGVKDANGCVVFQPVTIGNEPALVLDPLTVNQCANVTSYTINAVANGGFGIKTYTSATALPTATPGVFSFPAPAVATPVTITVTDANGCTDSKTITINPKLNLSLTNVIQPTCAVGTNTSGNNGSVTANGIGGTGTYTYSILPLTAGLVQTLNVFTNLQAGQLYTIEVKDTNAPTNCSDIKTITLVAPTPVVIASVDTLPVSCFGGSDGQIKVNFAVGTNITQYTFVLDPGLGQTSQIGNNVFTGVSSGPHTIKVVSNQNCEEVRTPVAVGTPTQVTLTGTAAAFTCQANNTVGNAVVTLVGANGTIGTGYMYSENGLPGSYTSNPSAFSVTDTGLDRTVTYYVQDGNFCTGTGTVQIFTAKKITDFTVNQITAISCTGPEKVEVINVVGGVGPYTYTINSIANTVAPFNEFNLPTATTYSVRVTDSATGCYLDKDYTVLPYGNFSVVVAPPVAITCFGGTSSLSFNVTGFVGAFTYNIFKLGTVLPIYSGLGNATAVPVPVVTNLVQAGVYTVIVKQTAAPECEITSNTVPITAPATDLSLSLVSNVNGFCTSPLSVVTVQGAGGTPSTAGYTYAIVASGSPVPNPLTGYSAVPTATFTANLNPTTSLTWTAYVKDANGCVIATPLNITIASDPNPTISLVAPLGNQCDLSGANYAINVSSPPAVGATLPWSYSITVNGGTPSLFTTNYSVPFPSTGTTTAIVTVKDKNGCTASTAPITIYPSLGLTALMTKQPTCPSFNDGEVTVSAIGGNNIYVYSILPVGPLFTASGTGGVFTGLNALTTYTIKVENIATGCSTTKTVTPLQPSLPVLATIPSTQINVKCAGDTTGSFVINLAPQTTTVNNDPLYTFTITSQPVGAVPIVVNNSFSGLIAGTYIVEIKSNSNCTITHTVIITQPNPLVVPAPIVTAASCPANSNVSAFAVITSPLTGASAVSGGTVGTGYLYQFSQGVLTNVVQPFGTDNSHTVTSPITVATQFFLTVQDANGCIVSSTAVTVQPFTKLDTIKVDTNQLITCAPGSLQNITVTVATTPSVPAVAPNLTYTVSSIPAGFTVSNTTGIFNGANGLPIGNYNVIVKNNDTNCELKGAVYYVNNPNTFQANATNIVNLTCYNSNNGSAAITIVDNIININDPDNAGAFSYTITQNGNAYGSGNSPNAGPFTINNLPAGNYVVSATLTASPFCIVPPTSFTITQPDELQIIAVKSADVTCRNTGNAGEGAISVTVSGGVGPYLVNVTRTAPGAAFTYATNVAPGTIGGLIAGTYSVTITDGTTPVACSKPASIVILAPQAPISNGTLSSNLVGNRLLCKDDKNAQITVSGLLGGQPSSYQYTLNNITDPLAVIPNGPQQSPVFNLTGTGYGAGTYTVSVQDGYGCGVFTTLPIVITEPTEIVPILSNPNPIDCTGVAGLILSASGGTPPYFYSETAGGLFTQFPIATPLSVSFPKGPGTYKYFVKDANGCLSLVSNEVIVPQAPVLIIKTVKSTDITCVSTTSGTITAVAEGGFDFNYNYNLSGSATGLPILQSNTTGEFINLGAGDYWVNVTTGGSCVSTLLPISIAPQLNFNVVPNQENVTCKGKNNGIIYISITGAIGPVEYIINPSNPISYKPLDLISGTNYVPITGLAPDTYTITIQDLGLNSNGLRNCPKTITVIITEPLLLNYTATTNLVQAYCTGDVTGSGTINIIPGTGTAPYRISTVDGSATFTATSTDANTFVVTGLTGGVHSVVVLDKNDCDVTIPINLDPSVTINESAEVKYLCPNPKNDTNNVIVSINTALLIAGSGNVQTYSLDGGAYQSSPIFPNVAPGVHFIDVKNEVSYTSPVRTSTCIKRINNINVRFIDPLAVTLTNGNLNEIIAITTGGTAPYNHEFNGVNTGTTATYLFPQTDKYFVTVTDKAGCTLTVSKTFTFIDIFIPNFFSPDGDGNNDGWSPQNTYNYKNLIFYVFDRFGRKIGTFNEGQIWDGKYDGQELPSGDYWYLVKPDGADDSKEYVGNFSLYR